MSLDFPAHPFWDFSIRVYSTDGVPPACLMLQEAHRLDVNVLLWCLWTGADGYGRLGADEVSRAAEAVEPWAAEVVRAMRAIRWRMKEGFDAVPFETAEPLRKRLGALEIQCEHAQQIALGGLIGRPADTARADEDRAADAVANAGLYLARIGATPSAEGRAALAKIVAAAFSDLDAQTVGALCDAA